MEFFCNYIWEKGFRDKNEDSLCIRHVRKDGTDYFLAVVCDGIGGLEEGEHAGSYVASAMAECFLRLLKKKRNLSDRMIRNAYRKAIYKCHRQLLQYGRENGIRLGTTLSMIMFAGCKGYIFHVGDSAVFAGGRCIKRLTPVQQDKSGALLQAVGTGKTPIPFCRKIRMRKGMVLLLTSDGFYKKSEQRICTKEWTRRIECNEKRMGELLVAVKDNVQALGEKDNISVICIKVGGRK